MHLEEYNFDSCVALALKLSLGRFLGPVFKNRLRGEVSGKVKQLLKDSAADPKYEPNGNVASMMIQSDLTSAITEVGNAAEQHRKKKKSRPTACRFFD